MSLKAKIVIKDEIIILTTEILTENKEDFSLRNQELSEIISETEKEEGIIEKIEALRKKIDDRILSSYSRIRNSVRNGLALVSVDRDDVEVVLIRFPHKDN